MLCFQGIPILIIGHHILQGKVVDLTHPLVAMKRDSIGHDEDSVNYNINAVIRRKLLFKTRPKPITELNPKC